MDTIKYMLDTMIFTARQKEMLDQEYCSIMDISDALDNRVEEGIEFGSELEMYLENKLGVSDLDISFNYDSGKMTIVFKESKEFREAIDDFFNYGDSKSKIILINKGGKLEIDYYSCFNSSLTKMKELLNSDVSESMLAFYDYWFINRNEEKHHCRFGQEILNANLNETGFYFNIINGILSLYYTERIGYNDSKYNFPSVSLSKTGVVPQLEDHKSKDTYNKNYGPCFNKAYVRIDSLPGYLRDRVTDIRNKHILDKLSAPQKKIGIR